ncbi:hypothetical protein ACFVXA_37450 [Streptomyces sp. NPDC058246]|uniref:hypothetical protein n=1 Tax=unclassified Streptomyces TaxID=2593676 RepID=UPI0034E5CAD6
MTTNPTRRENSDHRELRIVLLLTVLVLGLLITAAAVYLARVHPALAQPLGVGAAVMSALTAIAGVVARTIRR